VYTDVNFVLYSSNTYTRSSYVYLVVLCIKTYEDEISLTSVPWGITVVPCTDKAVVTLPGEGSIQFINTTNNTKDNKPRYTGKRYFIFIGFVILVYIYLRMR
jgi:hypothetical protein